MRDAKCADVEAHIKNGFKVKYQGKMYTLSPDNPNFCFCSPFAYLHPSYANDYGKGRYFELCPFDLQVIRGEDYGYTLDLRAKVGIMPKDLSMLCLVSRAVM